MVDHLVLGLGPRLDKIFMQVIPLRYTTRDTESERSNGSILKLGLGLPTANLPISINV